MAIYKNKKNNSYYCVYYSNGKYHTKRGFETKAEAAQYELHAKYEEDHPTTMRFYQVAKEYRDYTKQGISYGTYVRVGAFFEHYILPNFKDKRLSDITDLDCLRFWQYLKSLDKSSGYKNDILGAFKAIFRYACDYYGLEKSPAEKLKRFQKSREEKLRRKNKDLKVWTNEEFNKFINCVDNQMYKALFITLYYTGMRKGECLALTWKDMKDHKISVEKSLTRKTDLESCYEIKEPKNVYSIRDISLNDSVYDYLLSYKKKETSLPGFSEDWFMFGRLEPIAENTLTRAKDVAINKAGVKRIGIHDFRHSHASNLIANGVNIVAVSKRLGHSDVAMTLSVYTHLLEKNDDELVNNIEENSKLIINSLSR